MVLSTQFEGIIMTKKSLYSLENNIIENVLEKCFKLLY